jgi:hypothetical protein
MSITAFTTTRIDEMSSAGETEQVMDISFVRLPSDLYQQGIKPASMERVEKPRINLGLVQYINPRCHGR